MKVVNKTQAEEATIVIRLTKSEMEMVVEAFAHHYEHITNHCTIKTHPAEQLLFSELCSAEESM